MASVHGWRSLGKASSNSEPGRRAGRTARRLQRSSGPASTPRTRSPCRSTVRVAHHRRQPRTPAANRLRRERERIRIVFRAHFHARLSASPPQATRQELRQGRTACTGGSRDPRTPWPTMCHREIWTPARDQATIGLSTRDPMVGLNVHDLNTCDDLHLLRLLQRRRLILPRCWRQGNRQLAV
jgi:xanthine/CO dehydrogenase XdhC/CoxF family maturation factor